MNHSRVLPFLIFCTLSLSSAAQELARRAFFGIQMEPVTADVQRVMNLPAIKGVLIQRVFPGSTAEAAGLQQGDVLLTIDGTEVNSPDAAVQKVGAYRAGDKLKYTFHRAGVTHTKETSAQAYPVETYADLDVVYGSVHAGDAILRTIVTRQKEAGGKKPALLFVQGVGCYSMDTPLDTMRSETQLINAIARQGYVVMRVDKPGIGDSKGDPCNTIDFETELGGYLAAFTALRQQTDVDPEQCFIFGHSMGGAMAPRIAELHPVKGIIVFGTLAYNFMEYFTLTRRTIADAYGMSPGEADDFIKTNCGCVSMMINARLSREEAVKISPACAEVYDFLDSRDEDFWLQLQAMNLPALWQQYQGSVLAIKGELDYITTREEHEYIADIVNQVNPGHGTFLEIENCTHAMETAQSIEDAMNNAGLYHREISPLVTGWLQAQTTSSKKVTTAQKDQAQRILWVDGNENAYPRFSADGQQILFQSNRTGKWHIYIMSADGSNVRQLTTGEHNNNFPDWSADGRQVAFVSDRDGNEEVYIMQLDGTGLKRLTNDPGRDIHPYFSHDGKTLLFNSSRDNAQSFEIYRMTTDGKNVQRLTETPEVETCARYSPDGRKILYLKGFNDGSDEICVMDADGSNHVNLTHTPQMEGWPAWSADGQKIIFSSRRNGNYCLYEMNSDGSDVRQITTAPPGYEDARAGYAANGDIVFNRQRSGTIGIYVLRKRV